MTFRRSIRTTLGHNILIVATLAAVLMYGLADGEQGAVRPAVADSAAALVAAYGCGDDVADPTHAVVTVDQETRYVGQRLTDKAIEQAVFGVDHDLVVHGFCR